MIGDRIQQLRQFLQMNQTDFGRLINVTHSAVSRMEKGETKPMAKTIRAICIAYEANETWLKTGKGPMFRDVGTPPAGTAEMEHVSETGTRYIGTIAGEKVTEPEYELLIKVLKVVRGKWKGQYEISLRQNIDSFHMACKAEEVEPYAARGGTTVEHPPQQDQKTSAELSRGDQQSARAGNDNSK